MAGRGKTKHKIEGNLTTLDLQFQIENHRNYDSIVFHHWHQWNKALGVIVSSSICQELTNSTAEPSDQYYIYQIGDKKRIDLKLS
jgi:hypothetical protein